MADTPWKRFERRVAKSLGGKRTGAFGASISDVEGTAFSVECKRTKRVTGGIQGAWIAQARAQGLVEGRPWVLVVAMVSDRKPVVVCDFAQFVEIAKRAGMIEEEQVAVADETVFTEAGAMTVALDEQGRIVDEPEGTYSSNWGRTRKRRT
jgi:hypothetical protein